MLRAHLATGGELLFCGHHARQHGPRLHALAARLSIGLGESHSRVGPDVPGQLPPGGTQSWVSHPG